MQTKTLKSTFMVLGFLQLVTETESDTWVGLLTVSFDHCGETGSEHLQELHPSLSVCEAYRGIHPVANPLKLQATSLLLTVNRETFIQTSCVEFLSCLFAAEAFLYSSIYETCLLICSVTFSKSPEDGKQMIKLIFDFPFFMFIPTHRFSQL
ncbi:hypothetical protein ILYODFUR_022211 [Ilyodon furcidens]|uniref:Uncharacterized protein n=1 Tax=Ilyodon furcidens TaxID=33524 RepID=A0ABV0TE20_9TELE